MRKKCTCITALMTDEHKTRFAENVKRTPGGCHHWQGAKTLNGYGQIRASGRTLYAHRVAWAIANGTDPGEGLMVLHSCGNKACVNPRHLRTGTASDNTADWYRERGGKPKTMDPEKVRNVRAVTYGLVGRRMGLAVRALAEMYGTSPDHIRKIVAGHRWASVA